MADAFSLLTAAQVGAEAAVAPTIENNSGGWGLFVNSSRCVLVEQVRLLRSVFSFFACCCFFKQRFLCER
jgi:hypothetical protein